LLGYIHYEDHPNNSTFEIPRGNLIAPWDDFEQVKFMEMYQKNKTVIERAKQDVIKKYNRLHQYEAEGRGFDYNTLNWTYEHDTFEKEIQAIHDSSPEEFRNFTVPEVEEWRQFKKSQKEEYDKYLEKLIRKKNMEKDDSEDEGVKGKKSKKDKDIDEDSNEEIDRLLFDDEDSPQK
jgi:hypothetical protein